MALHGLYLFKVFIYIAHSRYRYTVILTVRNVSIACILSCAIISYAQYYR